MDGRTDKFVYIRLTQYTQNARDAHDIGDKDWYKDDGGHSVAIFVLKRVHEGHVVLGTNWFDKEEGT